MAIKPIVLFPDPVLLRPTEEVGPVDDGIRQLVEDMRETMYAAPGIGLAANQVGFSIRLCLVDLTAGEEPGNLHVFLNPAIRDEVGSETAEEGCLSFPDIHVNVNRATSITVDAMDLEGKAFSLQAEGLMARAIQHECEHLDGQTFLRNVSSLKRELVKKQIRKRIKSGDWIHTVES